MVIPDICNNYYMEVIHGIESVMEQQGVEVLICNTDEDPRKDLMYTKSYSVEQIIKMMEETVNPLLSAQ